jgi:hypothetical protein
MIKKRTLRNNGKMQREEKRKKTLRTKQLNYKSKKQHICNAHKTRKDCHHWTKVKQNPNPYKAQCVWLRDILTPWKSSCRDENNGFREKQSFNDFGSPRFKT